MTLLKPIHLLIATLLLAFLLANYYQQIALNNQQTIKSRLTTTLFTATLVTVLFISGTLLTPQYHYTYHTPWITAAYSLLSLNTLLWITYLWIKHPKPWLTHTIYLTLLSTFILIIKDAVTKQTWL